MWWYRKASGEDWGVSTPSHIRVLGFERPAPQTYIIDFGKSPELTLGIFLGRRRVGNPEDTLLCVVVYRKARGEDEGFSTLHHIRV